MQGRGERMTKTTTEMQLVPIAKLVPYVNNARTHSPEQITKLRSSLREFGFINPVIIDRDFNVIAGHGRILAAKEEGITEVPCVFADHLTEAQKKAYIIADNRMAMDAGWDEELLRVEIESLQGMDFDPLLTGFDEKELADLFADDSGSEVRDDDFDLTAALEKASFVERGDVWTVGRHRLVCGDATSAEDVALLMNGRKANLIVTDPPYGVSFKSSSGLTIQNDSMKDEEFYNFLLSAFQCMAEHLEKGGARGYFCGEKWGADPILRPCEGGGDLVNPIYIHSRKPDRDARDTPGSQTLTLGSLFDGSGGFPLGGLLCGITPVWASEIEPFPIRVTTKRLPFMKHYGDVSRMDGGKIEPVDVITFGSPCQDMSIAGKRAGLDGSRSNLFYEAIRIVREMRCATDEKYPRWLRCMNL